MNIVTTVISITIWNNLDPGCDSALEGDMFPQASNVMDFGISLNQQSLP